MLKLAIEPAPLPQSSRLDRDVYSSVIRVHVTREEYRRIYAAAQRDGKHIADFVADAAGAAAGEVK